MRCCSRYELGFKLWWRLHHHLVGGSGCNVVAILSANKTDKINPVSHLHEQGWSCVVVKTSND